VLVVPPIGPSQCRVAAIVGKAVAGRGGCRIESAYELGALNTAPFLSADAETIGIALRHRLGMRFKSSSFPAGTRFADGSVASSHDVR
jgi:hypothetical protein